MTLGIVGGGQLGLMLAQAAGELGVRSRVLDPSPDACAQQSAELIVGPYDDTDALAELARGCDAVTYEFENVCPETLERIEQDGVAVHPTPEALRVTQDRVAEKTFAQRLGLGTAPFVPVSSLKDLHGASRSLGGAMIVKTRRLGYDGKGQWRLRAGDDLHSAWEHMSGACARTGLVAEGLVPFERELSIVAARAGDGSCAVHPVVQNEHRDGILHTTLAPAPGWTPALQSRAERLVRTALESLRYVGVLTVELFESAGTLLVNECACRVHNSGHWTIEGARTSQFENHVRAVLGMELGDASPIRAEPGSCVMLNLVGAEPNTDAVRAVPNAHLHLYGKAPLPGRKIGHITAQADNAERAKAALAELESASLWAV